MKEGESPILPGGDIPCPYISKTGLSPQPRNVFGGNIAVSGLPGEINVLSQLQSEQYSLYEVAHGVLLTFRATDPNGVIRQEQMLRIRQQQDLQEDRFAERFLESKATEPRDSASTPLTFPLLTDSQELFVVADMDLATWILSDPKTFDRARTLESFADAFHLNSVFTTKDLALYRDLKRFFTHQTNNLPPGQYRTIQDSFEGHVDSMLTKFDSNSEVPFVPKVEGMVLEAYADAFFGIKKFPDAEECAALIKSIWQVKSLQNNIPSQHADQSLSLKMGQMKERLFRIVENAQSLVDQSRSKTADEMAQAYLSNGHETGNLLNAFIPLYEAIARGLVYAFVELGHSPSLQEELYKEVTQNTQDEQKYCKSTSTLLHRVWQETLRLRPPTPNQTRRVTTEDNALFPYGSKVVIVWSLFHQNPRVWGEDAGQFNPNRWLDVSSAQKQYYNPFGAGAQRCVAMDYASFGGRVMLKRIVESATIHPKNEDSKPESIAGDRGYSRGPDPEKSVLRFASHKAD